MSVEYRRNLQLEIWLAIDVGRWSESRPWLQVFPRSLTMVLFFTSSSESTSAGRWSYSDSIVAVNPPATIYMGKDKVESMCLCVSHTRPIFTRTDQMRISSSMRGLRTSGFTSTGSLPLTYTSACQRAWLGRRYRSPSCKTARSW